MSFPTPPHPTQEEHGGGRRNLQDMGAICWQWERGVTRRGNLVPTMPRYVSPEVKHMGPFSASSEWNDWEYFIQNGCKICCVTQYGYESVLSVVYSYTCKNGENELWSALTIHVSNDWKVRDREWPFWIIPPYSLILHHNMGVKCAEDSFNMGMFFFYLRRASSSYWVLFRPPTHTSGHFILESPPGVGLPGGQYRRLVVGWDRADAVSITARPALRRGAASSDGW